MGMKLFEPFKIKSMELKNRIGLAPLLNMPDVLTTFTITDNTVKWFEARAKGGAGLIMTGTLAPALLNLPGAMERVAQIAEMVHSYGAKFGVQTGGGGPMIGVGPSGPPYPDELHPKQSISEIMIGKLSPFPGIEGVVELTVDDIKQNINDFANVAVMLKEAGVDCVELHCAHGGATLYCSFISPFYNRRTDDYGGNWENRLRFPVETIKAMRKAVGKDYPLLVRISADELLKDRGITLEDTTQIIVPALEKAGVDCFDVSQGSILHSPQGITIPMYYPRGCYIHNAAAVKQVTKLPVIGVGRIVDLDMAEKFLQEDKADIIYLGRQLTSDPETPNKYLDGRFEDIRKCIGCLEGCGTPCPVNYDLQPGSLALEPAEKSKKVLVIGGGVAGMEAARVCALRGHEVTLLEKSPELGGIVAALALNPLNAEFNNFVEFLGNQMRRLKVEVRVCKEVTAADVKELKPDVVIVATGSALTLPEVTEGKPLVMDHIEALRKKNAIGDKVVVWGHVYGAELAVALAKEGKDVTLIGEAGENALTSHSGNDRKFWMFKKLTDVNAVRSHPREARVSNPKVLYNIKVEDITPEGIKIVSRQGRKDILPYDTLIISRGRKSVDSLFNELEGKVKEIYKIGDCSTVANIKGAVWSANEVARKI
ncbi:MAG: FAD-dependent oxidoreductase [Deltaproteobacteria bacterium]|nr:FAD-dependent oxidoreductase [Deltaproteobacteria bacterium]